MGVNFALFSENAADCRAPGTLVRAVIRLATSRYFGQNGTVSIAIAYGALGKGDGGTVVERATRGKTRKRFPTSEAPNFLAFFELRVLCVSVVKFLSCSLNDRLCCSSS
jgi:hypothetical protein